MRILIVVTLLIGCHSGDTGLEQTLRFNDEETFKRALTGTWVLKDYRDSVLAGKRPVSLAKLLAGTNRLVYNPMSGLSYTFPEDSSYYVFVDRTDIFIQSGYSIEFVLRSNSVRLIEKGTISNYDTTTKKWVNKIQPPKKVGVMNFTLVRKDTLLDILFFGDSLKSTLIKSVDYYVLLNRAYISGKYSVLYGARRGHYITFNDDGQVQGLENLSSSLAYMDRYEIDMSSYVNHVDRIYFLNLKTKLSMVYLWERTDDALVLKTLDPFGNRFILEQLK